jgi:hypothetical protein
MNFRAYSGYGLGLVKGIYIYTKGAYIYYIYTKGALGFFMPNIY